MEADRWVKIRMTIAIGAILVLMMLGAMISIVLPLP